MNFQAPKDWKKVIDSTFVLKDYDKQFELWSHGLAEGHMPWRLALENVAVTCLLEFGMKDAKHMRVWEFGSSLKVLNKDEVYLLAVGTEEYVVFVRSKAYHDIFKDGQGRERTQYYSIPIACNLEVTHVSKNGG